MGELIQIQDIPKDKTIKAKTHIVISSLKYIIVIIKIKILCKLFSY